MHFVYFWFPAYLGGGPVQEWFDITITITIIITITITIIITITITVTKYFKETKVKSETFISTCLICYFNCIKVINIVYSKMQ